MKEGRVVIVHNHFFKNAGSTIDWALKRNFKRGFIDHRDDERMMKGADYLGPYLLANPHIKALSTHHLRLPLPHLDGVLLPQIITLRHPIERVTSVYKFETKQVTAKTPGAMHARKYDISEYVQWRMNPDVGATIRNFIVTRCLPPRKYRKRLFTEEEMKEAAAYLENVEMLGIVRRFDESMVLFEDYLRGFFPKIDLSYRAQNIGQDLTESDAKRIGWLKESIGDSVFERLLNANREDLEIYDFALHLLEKRISQTENFAEKYNDFRKRCARYESHLFYGRVLWPRR